jgi:hypothetical protein
MGNAGMRRRGLLLPLCFGKLHGGEITHINLLNAKLLKNLMLYLPKVSNGYHEKEVIYVTN